MFGRALAGEESQSSHISDEMMSQMNEKTGILIMQTPIFFFIKDAWSLWAQGH